jgi:V8-like Glu-specific endopeptidase
MAKTKKKIPHRNFAPIPAEKIEAQKSLPSTTSNTSKGRASVPRSIRTLYVTAPKGREPHPSVRVNRLEEQQDGGALWRLDLDLDGSVETHRHGLRDQPIELSKVSLPPSKPRTRTKGLDGYCPPSLGVSFKPQVQAPIGQVLYEFRGRIHRPLYIFGSDDRHVLTDTSFPWLLVGKISTSDGKSGSGALVGDRIVLTARHLRPEKSIAAGNWWMKFTPHYFDGTELFGSSFISDSHYFGKTGDTGFDLSHDFMVCRLFEPLGERLGFLGVQEYTEDWNDLEVWASVGYPGDLAGGERPFVELRCSIEDSEDYGGAQMLETESDLTPGNSGGPFWAWFDGNDGKQHTRIVAVVSDEADFATSLGFATIHDHDNGLAGGADMVNIVRWARENWK